MSIISELGRLRLRDCNKFKNSLGYIQDFVEIRDLPPVTSHVITYEE